MKTISLGISLFALLACATPRASAQESATQQQLDQVSATLQDVQSQLDQQGKRISDLEEKIAKMSDKLNTPSGGGDFASADDLKKLAAAVQEIDKKRQEDNQKILDAISKLGKGGSTGSSSHRMPEVSTAPVTDNTPPATAGQQQNGFWYVVQEGNTLSAIAKEYQAKGYKVTVKQILAANPGLTPSGLKVNQKIFIPQP